MRKRHIAILGSTGSIGRQTLDVVRQHPDRFDVELITANNSSDLLIEQAREFDVNNVVICNPDKYAQVRDGLADTDSKVFCGIDSACSLAAADGVDIVVAAMVGFSGLLPAASRSTSYASLEMKISIFGLSAKRSSFTTRLNSSRL